MDYSKKNKLLTVNEFANAAGISRQAVYTAIKGKLTKYVNKVDSQTMLDSTALLEVYGISDCQEVEQPIDKEVDNELTTLLRGQIADLKQEIADLKRQLEKKDELIEAKDKELSEARTETYELAKRAMTLTQGQQLITAKEQDKDVEVVTQEPMDIPQNKFKAWFKRKMKG